MVKKEIKSAIKKALEDLEILGVEPLVEAPADPRHGDYSSNIALAIFGNKELGIMNKGFKSPLELAEKISSIIRDSSFIILSKVEVLPPGFINFWLSKEYLLRNLQDVLDKLEQYGTTDQLKGRKIMVEYAHPNTHKEMHIGHMRTLITGEALARILESNGANVFRANYQGDIGPHVAKAIYGVKKLLKERNLSLSEIESWSNQDKAHFLGEAYVLGNKDYEKNKEEIDKINAELYELISHSGNPAKAGASRISSGVDSGQARMTDNFDLYKITRQWSLGYYDDFYKRFYTKFDRLFFESEVADCGKKIVLENVGSPRSAGGAGKVFEESEGAIIFPGEKYARLAEDGESRRGLHKRVFVTRAGYPTYEGKDMCLGFKQYEAFPFDKNIHVVASEQAGYFKVVIKALELLDPEKFKGKEYHLSMGMVQLSDRKMSSRTGEVLTVDWLINQVESRVLELMEEGRIKTEEKGQVVEEITIGAIKYSVLKANTLQNVTFDIEKSISLEGDSGPYLQYAYARTQSVLRKLKVESGKLKIDEKNSQFSTLNSQLEVEELQLLRLLAKFPDIIEKAGGTYAPNLLCGYLFELAKAFNLFYQKHSILQSANKDFRIVLTAAAGQTIKNGLHLLGIKAPQKM